MDAAAPDAGGLAAEVTGPAGNRVDLDGAFGSIDGTLLLVTGGLVLLLLVLIYRSPVFWLIPFLAAIFAKVVARRGVLPRRGGRHDQRSVGQHPACPALRCGHRLRAATGRSLREELRRHEAMAFALRGAGPAIVASGFTTVAALLVLMLAQLSGTVGLAVVGVVGIAAAMLAMMTVLPTLLLLVGRVAGRPTHNEH